MIPCYYYLLPQNTQHYSNILQYLLEEHLQFHLFPYQNVSPPSWNYKTNTSKDCIKWGFMK